MRRRSYLILGAVALLLAGGLVAGCRVLAAGSSPEAAVRGYFDALAARDGVAAAAYVAPLQDPPPLLNANRKAPLPDPNELIKGDGYTPPSQVELGEVTDDEAQQGRKMLWVTFNIGTRRVKHPFFLIKQKAGPSPDWRIYGGHLLLWTSGHSTTPLAINRTAIASGISQVRVYPGEYRVELAEHPLFYAEPQFLAIPDTTPRGPAEVRPLFREERLRELEPQVKSYLDGCATIASLQPKNCPFSAGTAGQVRDIRWAIVKYPQIGVGVRSDLTMFLNTKLSGRAEVTAVYTDGSLFRNPSNIIVHGNVKEVDGQLIFQAYTHP